MTLNRDVASLDYQLRYCYMNIIVFNGIFVFIHAFISVYTIPMYRWLQILVDFARVSQRLFVGGVDFSNEKPTGAGPWRAVGHQMYIPVGMYARILSSAVHSVEQGETTGHVAYLG